MERELPIRGIEETDFIVDVNKMELRQKGNETNVITLEQMKETETGYWFEFDIQERNAAQKWRNNETTPVWIPEFSDMDPEGMALKYDMTVDEVRIKTDFEIMIDQEAFDKRLKGLLPTVDIKGDTFYVDLRMDRLRPEANYLSNGIVFSEIDHFYDFETERYVIPYDPKKYEFRDIDYENVTEIPKDLVVISFPHETILDPVGWNRLNGFPVKEGLKSTGFQMEMKADIANWEDIYVPQKIKENLEKKRRATKKTKTARSMAKKTELENRKRRKM